jgi:hypothetical protein
LNHNENTIFGIVITVIIVGMSVMMVMSISTQPITAVYGCGSNTYYHKETNSCELFPPLNKNQIKLSQSLVTLMQNDTKISDDSIQYDDRGYAKENCPVMHGSNWSMDSNCIITLTKPMR